MCGIAGVLGDPSGATRLTRMLGAQLHRGPDGEGVLHDCDVHLGMRRLKIIGLSEGDQPRFDAAGRFAVFMNGEIYNHVEIKKGHAHPYRGDSDTEVVPHLWYARGEACLEDLRGMFALAVWDRKEGVLTLVRDRLGIKPLWIYQHEKVVAFASEIRAFAEASLPMTLDPSGLADYLTHSHIPAPRSPFTQVKLLQPGHLLTVSRVEGGGWTLRDRCWWKLPAPGLDPTPEDAVSVLRGLMDESMREHLRSDVPLGSLLSGGLDSTALTALAARQTGRRLHTFSVGYDVEGYDERPLAREAAQVLGTEHHETQVGVGDFFPNLDKAVRRGDTLMADQAIVALAPLYDEVKRHVTVVLDGDGADEIFAGYPTYSADHWMEKMVKLPAGLRTCLASLSPVIPEATGKGAWINKIERFLRHIHLTPAEAHALWRNIHTLQDRRLLLNPALFQGVEGRGIDSHMRSFQEAFGSLSHRLSAMDLAVWLPDDNLKKADGQSMGVSVEARVPFLDHRLVEAAMGWSPAFKRQRGVKWILREALKGVVPDSLLSRPKAGFHLPLASWLRGPLRTETRRRLEMLENMATDVFKPGALSTAFNSGRLDSYRIFNLLALSSWWQQWPTPPHIHR
ncbi:MAG: asparagine synthase (glutamine-hydrolyzing) [Planctomycetota bacterium]